MATDAYVPQIQGDKDGKFTLRDVNSALHYLGEAVNALAGRTGPLTIHDDVEIEGDLTCESVGFADTETLGKMVAFREGEGGGGILANGRVEVQTSSAALGGMGTVMAFGPDRFIDLLFGTHGEFATFGLSQEELDLSISTTSVGNLLPASSLILAVVARVTEDITRSLVAATIMSVGSPVQANRFIPNGGIALVAGSTGIGINQWRGNVTTENAGPSQAAALQVTVTPDGAGVLTGKVRITVFYLTFTPPQS